MLQNERSRHLKALSMNEMSFPSKLGKSLNLLKLTSTRFGLNHGYFESLRNKIHV